LEDQVANQNEPPRQRGHCVSEQQQHDLADLAQYAGQGLPEWRPFNLSVITSGREPFLKGGPDCRTTLCWTVQADEMSQGTDRGQALVPRGHTTGSLVFQFLQEQPYAVGSYVLDNQPINRSARTTGE
jgi:hypothetical protein